ncbi:hypothetical protein COOONC_14838 [Cooperia oncophora]
MSDLIDAEKRCRSIVISGLPEQGAELKPSEKQRELEEKVAGVLDVLNVECRPVEVYRMGRLSDVRPRVIKVVLPSRNHWLTALSNARFLRSSQYSHVYVRKSMTPDERRHDFELRQEANKRNNECGKKTWVVYKNELKNVKDLKTQDRKSGKGGGVCCLIKESFNFRQNHCMLLSRPPSHPWRFQSRCRLESGRSKKFDIQKIS